MRSLVAFCVGVLLASSAFAEGPGQPYPNYPGPAPISTSNSSPGGAANSIQYNNGGVLGGYGLGANLSIVGGNLTAAGGSPGPSDTFAQFNSSGSFAGSAGLTLSPTLVTGLSGAATNPLMSGNSTARWFGNINLTYDQDLNLDTGFSDANGLQLLLTNHFGQYSYNAHTQAKWTFIPLSVNAENHGMGQRFTITQQNSCYGMGDCFLNSNVVQFANGNISGDEGIGFESVSDLRQFRHLVLSNIFGSPIRTSCATTTTQVITGSTNPQAVSVASTAGCVVGDWIEVEPELPTVTPNHEGVQITAVGGGKITGIFRNNHVNTTQIVTAIYMTLDNGGNEIGQGRWLVNLTATPYTTGTISNISGSTMTGSGTAWTSLGFGITNPLCIAITNDDYNGPPFNGGSGNTNTLKSWYQIKAVNSNTSLDIYATTIAGVSGYQGPGKGSGGYTIRPCAEILLPNRGNVVLVDSTAAWNANDALEQAIVPWPDVTGHQEVVETYTPGGTYRSFWDIQNRGARKFQAGVQIGAQMQVGSNADINGWINGLTIGNSDTGITIDNNLTSVALALPNLATAAVNWGAVGASGVPVNQYISWAELGGNPALLLHGINGLTGTSDIGACTISASTSPHAWLGCNAQLAIGAIGTNSVSTRLRFHDDNGDPQAATNLFDIRYVTGSGADNGQPRYWALNWGLIIGTTNDDTPSGRDLFVIAGDDAAGTIGSPETAFATSGHNKQSGTYRWESSIWNGSAAAPRFMQGFVNPVSSNTTNSAIQFELHAVQAACGYVDYAADRVFSVLDNGKLSFGLSDDSGGFCDSATKLATLDPTNLTANRNIAVPDASGTMALTPPVWTTYTPTVACVTSGTITTDSVSGRYSISGKTVSVQVDINITVLGTCLGNLTATLPANVQAIMPAPAVNYTLGTAVPAVFDSSNKITMFFATAPAANHYYVGGTYEQP